MFEINDVILLYCIVWVKYLNRQRVMSHLVSQVPSAHALLVFTFASLEICLTCSEKWWRVCSRCCPGALTVPM